MIDFERVLDDIGCLGPYQWKLMILLSYVALPAGMHNVASVFYMPPINYRCKFPDHENSLYFASASSSDILNLTTPFNYKKMKYDVCHHYYLNSTCNDNIEPSCVRKDLMTTCENGYFYYSEDFAKTVQSEWDLVCARTIRRAIEVAVYFFGMWSGAILSGFFADRYGRRPVIVLGSLGTILSGIGASFSQSHIMFIIFRFGCGMFSHGAFITMCVFGMWPTFCMLFISKPTARLVMEFTGKRRTEAIIVHEPFAIGFGLNSLFSYFVRDWRMFYLIISLVPIPYLIFHIWIPESPMWHFSNGREEEGKYWATKFVRGNRKKIPDDNWEIYRETEVDVKKFDQKYSFLDLFKTRNLRRYTFNIMVAWFVVAIVYYGLSLNAGALAGNLFVNNALNAAFETIGLAIVILFVNKIGRKPLTCGSFLIGGLALILIIILAAWGISGTVTIVMAMIGKALLTTVFGLLFNYTGEIFPTVVRSNALGMGSMAARVSSIMCPFILELQSVRSWLPNAIFGTLSIIAGISSFFLPETKNAKMLQTIQEAEEYYESYF